MSLYLVDVILTLNPYYPISKMAAIACFQSNAIFMFVNSAALQTVSGVGAVKSFHSACQCKAFDLRPGDLTFKIAAMGNFEYIFNYLA